MSEQRRLDDETMADLERLLARPEPPDGSATPWMLTRFQAGDLSRGEAREVLAAARRDPAVAARLELLRAEDDAFEGLMPWEQVKDSIFRRARELPAVAAPAPTRRWLGAWPALVAGGLAAAAAVVLVLLLEPAEPTIEADTLTSRYKTDDTIQAFVLRHGRPEPVAPGATLAEGDLLQFRVSSPHSFLALIGVDGTGVVSRYEPVGGELSATFVPGNGRPLADSLQLDDAPGPEVFLAFLSDEALLVEELERAVHDVVTADPGGSRAVLDRDWSTVGLAPQVAVFHVEKE
jgi:hypothetical protein